MVQKTMLRFLLAAGVAAAAVSAQANVFNMGGGNTSLSFVQVGDPGNVPDTQVMSDGTTGYGSVGYTYYMGKYDVTVGQYCQFLNAVAKTDPYGLYYSYMVTDMPYIALTRSGSSGNYSYAIMGSDSQAANCPIFDATWGDAARFCNWLQNGQPSGGEGNGTTETGAYTLDGAISISALMAVTRNSGATYFLPTENEWYKAAYYKSGGTNAGYWLYPTRSNTTPSNVLSATGTNNANFQGTNGMSSDPTYVLTPVGEFADSPGPYDTYDMGGDVWQWNEADIAGSGRGVRGGWYQDTANGLVSSARTPGGYPTDESETIGFRVASSQPTPEPGSIALLLAGGFCLLAYAWRRRRRAA